MTATTPENLPTIAEILTHAAAQRYALALSTAAAAQARIDALEEALKDSEWLRLQAEDLAMRISSPEEMGRVWHMGTEPPPGDVAGLIDLTSGTPWLRDRDPQLWRRLGTGSYSTRYAWPIDDSGPFIALPDASGLSTLGRTLDIVIADHNEVRRQISGRPGYSEDGESYWARPTLHEATGRVLATADRTEASLREKLDILEGGE